MMEFEERADAAADVVTVRGEVDTANVQRFEAAIGPRDRALVVDLDGLDYVDSAGVRALFGAVKAQEARGQRCLFVAGPGTASALVLRVSGVDSAYVCSTPLEAQHRLTDGAAIVKAHDK
jgi:anti-anti-sigma factor